MVLTYSNGASQTFTATVTAVHNTGSPKSIDWTLTDSSLSSVTPSLTDGSNTVRVSGFNGTNFPSSTASNFSYVTCFVRGTLITTPDGTTAVEALSAGDAVVLGDGATARIRWIGRRTLDLKAYRRRELAAPVRIVRHAFADNVPCRDLLLSPDHAILVDDMLICARQLVNGVTIRQELHHDTVEYFHIELEAHAILLAEGLAVESYLDTGNRGFFANSGEPLVLRPDLTDTASTPTREAHSCRPFVSDETFVKPAWRRLADRAAALGSAVPATSTTNDPEPVLTIGGRTIAPTSHAAGSFSFVVPPGAMAATLLSRSATPTASRPWLEDRRCLGMRIARLVVRNQIETIEIPVDHPSLTRGWWAVERDGPMLRRWTDGAAAIALPPMSGVRVLEVHVSDTVPYVVSSECERRAA
ncbi:MAG: Hint domain-containing protein [Acetobacteraceae bacterium]